YFDIFKKHKYMIWYSYAQGIFFLAFSFSPLMVSGVKPFRDVFTFWPQPGAFHPYYLFNFLIIIIYSTYLLISQYRKSQGMQKLKIKYLILASFFAYFSACSNFPLWYGIPVIPVTNVLFAFFPLLIAYSIIKHRLMDIKLVLKKSTVLLASIGTILAYLIGIRYLSLKLFPYVGFWMDTLLVLTSISIYPAIKNFYLKLANKYFFSSLYNFQELVADLSGKISSTLDINDIYKYIDESFYSAFYPKNFALLLYEKSNKSFLLKYSSNLNVASQKELQKNINQLAGMINQQKIIFIDDLALATDNEIKTTVQELKEMHVSLLLPLYFEGEIIGLAVLGDKESEEIYNDEDVAVFNVVLAQIAISVKNALLHKESLVYADNLNTEKNKISSILANFIDPVIFIDKNKQLRIFNPAAQNVFGMEISDVGKNIEEIVFKTNELKLAIINEGQAQTADNQQEIFIEQNGNQKYYKALSAQVLNDKKEFIGTLKIFYDLTKEKELDKSKSEFISVAAHQLRTPLSTIKWIFDLLLKNEAGKVRPEQRHYMEMGNISNEKLIIIVNDLLNVSRIEEGNFKLNLSSCDIKKILTEAQIDINNVIKGKNIDVQYELAENLLAITVDKEKLLTVLENVLINAANYTPENGKIKISAMVEGGFLLISVADNGIGIPEEEKKKVFSKLFRATNAIRAHPDGSGLGLFIAKKIIKMHKGDVTFESQEGIGTKFIIKLPMAKE
ncbi:PAS domain-containing protein, partial [Patescibacteria group bacterium]|nr:PAS domain-containing protein [Patescibacteria group bacterium]